MPVSLLTAAPLVVVANRVTSTETVLGATESQRHRVLLWEWFVKSLGSWQRTLFTINVSVTLCPPDLLSGWPLWLTLFGFSLAC